MAVSAANANMCSMEYVELHCHSAFSFLDGASLPDELVPAALELGHRTMALTDHNSVSGSMEFAVSARALGLRPTTAPSSTWPTSDT
jgi:error-prone DNA polymerase